jgi:hypothetical protein
MLHSGVESSQNDARWPREKHPDERYWPKWCDKRHSASEELRLSGGAMAGFNWLYP